MSISGSTTSYEQSEKLLLKVFDIQEAAMLELLYIGRLDYLARRNIHNPIPLPDDLAVEEAFLKLKATAEHVSSGTDATEPSKLADNKPLKYGN